jgi:hypothetical protein
VLGTKWTVIGGAVRARRACQDGGMEHVGWAASWST